MVKYATRLLATLVIAAAALVGAHSGRALADAPKYSVEEADFASHLMVLSAEELPGDGWNVTKQDQFDDDSTIPDTKECRDSAIKLKGMDDKIKASRAGRAETELSKEGGLSVDSKIEIYQTADVLSGYVDASKPIFLSDSFNACLKATVEQEIGDGTKVSVKTVNASSKAPSGGFAKAVEITVPNLGVLHFEFYGWADSNAVASLSFSGDPSQINADLTDQGIQSMLLSMAIVGSLTP